MYREVCRFDPDSRYRQDKEKHHASDVSLYCFRAKIFIASVYILFSDSLGKFYIGSCKDIDNRLQQHRLKAFTTSFTSKANDWQVFLLISVPIAIGMGYEQARKIEGHIKRMKSSVYIKNLKQYPEIIEKLIQIYS